MQNQDQVTPEELVDNAAADEGAQQPDARIAELEAQIAELKDQFLRAKADTENMRRRAAEDVAAAGKYAVGKIAVELLPVKDCLEMALLDTSGNIEAMKMGVDMTLKQLVTAFDKAQIIDINPEVGEKLDPHRHQAMSMEDSEQDANTVVRVMQKGYLIADRVLRPAMVIVARPKA